MNCIDLINAVGSEKVDTMLKELPRKAQRAAIKEAGTRKRRGLVVNPRKQREKELEALKASILEGGEEAADALLYGWLTSKRWPMLADFLDQFAIDHRQGLTNEDLAFLGELSDEKIQVAASKLVEKYSAEDAAIYLHYLGHKNEVDLIGKVPDLAKIYPEPEGSQTESKAEAASEDAGSEKAAAT